jgi:hypothetical protein
LAWLLTLGHAVKITVPLLLCGVVMASPISQADTETIKLSCDLDVTTQPSYGGSRHSHETAAVVLLFDAATGFKAIRIYAVAIPVAVANKKGGAVTSFTDNSDEYRWDISNRRDRSKVASDESAVIDRTTGHITAHSTTTVGEASQQVEARGTCTKVDSSKRKPAQRQSGPDYVPARRPLQPALRALPLGSQCARRAFT